MRLLAFLVSVVTFGLTMLGCGVVYGFVDVYILDHFDPKFGRDGTFGLHLFVHLIVTAVITIAYAILVGMLEAVDRVLSRTFLWQVCLYAAAIGFVISVGWLLMITSPPIFFLVIVFSAFGVSRVRQSGDKYEGNGSESANGD